MRTDLAAVAAVVLVVLTGCSNSSDAQAARAAASQAAEDRAAVEVLASQAATDRAVVEAEAAAEQAVAEEAAAAEQASSDRGAAEAKDAAEQAVGRQAAERAAWGDGRTDFTKAGGPPEFPEALPGLRKTSSDTQTVRAFDSGEWSTMYEFPNTMNGCDLQRFLIRWRSVSGATIDATLGYDPSNPDFPVSRPASGKAGWMSSNGCEQPAFRLANSPDGSTLSDVVVEVQVWEPGVS